MGRRTARRTSRRVAKRQQAAQPAPAPAQQPAAAPPPAAGPSSEPAEFDYTAELEKLAALKKQGILTDEEFAAKKKQLLGL